PCTLARATGFCASTRQRYGLDREPKRTGRGREDRFFFLERNVGAPMAIAKAERLMNLALCLMNTRRPLTKRELRASTEAYREVHCEDAFNRMFERDKDDLRELGLVIETVDSLDG